VLAVVAAMTTGAVVTEGSGKLRRMISGVFKESATVGMGGGLPDSEAGFSLPANSSRLEIDGSEGFFSSAGGEGGD